MSTLTSVKKELTKLRTLSTKLVNSLTEDCINGLRSAEAQVQANKIKSYLINFVPLNAKIMDDLIANGTDQELVDAEIKNESYNDKLNTCLIDLDARINALAAMQVAPPSMFIGTAHAINRSQLQLPKIPLPIFHADPSKDTYTCQNYFETIDQLLSSYGLGDQEKYSLLESHCRSRALTMIQSLSLRNRSYSTAKTILLKSFAEEVPQKFATIKKLSDLKLKSEGDPYIFYAEFTKLTETCIDQKIDRDTFIQYYIWNALPTSMQDTVIAISQSSYPKLKEIQNSFLAASSRFEASQKVKRGTVDRTVVSHATCLKTEDNESVSDFNKSSYFGMNNNKKSICFFCPKSENHSSARCTVYDTIDKKRKRVAELHLCFKCLRSGHLGRNCSFKMTGKCHKCQRLHWSFLCNRVSATNRALPTSNSVAIEELESFDYFSNFNEEYEKSEPEA